MTQHLLHLALALLLPLIPLRADTAEPEANPADLPRTEPISPGNAPASFVTKPGFHLEITAAEPLIRDPIEICFDENGRLFVVEMIDYSELRGENPHLGQIRMLEDTDGDGRYDRSQVYADNLPWPTAVTCWKGGIFVAATPDIFYLKDTDNDGRADQREVVFTGFASAYAPYATNQLNVQAMLNSFRWGLDNRIHGVTSLNGGNVVNPASPGTTPLNLRGRDFAFNPETRQISAEPGGGQYGMSFDNTGHRFTCNNSDHIRVFMYDSRYTDQNPSASMPPSAQSIADDGPSATVYRISPDEPWRVIRTQWRVSGAVKGIVEGGGRPSGYFTSATGLTIYRGDAYPEEYLNNAFIADCGSNLIHRKRIYRDGVDFHATRPDDEQTSEFLASSDLWFRPVQMANAPDGTLWVIDMYREIIEHPWSLPRGIKKHLDLNAGNDRGRLYRIAPKGFTPRPPPRLGQASTAELVATLAHPNAWHRETAARLIYEQQDHALALPELERLLESSPSPLGRIHALHTLNGLNLLETRHILYSLRDLAPEARVHALQLLETKLPDIHTAPADDALWKPFLDLAQDPHPEVRFQLALTLSALPKSWSWQTQLALRIASYDTSSKWIYDALLCSTTTNAALLLNCLSELWVPQWKANSSSPNHNQTYLLTQLARTTGILGSPDDAKAIARLSATLPPSLSLAVLESLLKNRPKDAAPIPHEVMAASLTNIGDLSANPDAPDSDRILALSLLSHSPFDNSYPTLIRLLNPTQPQSIQLAALQTLGHYDHPEVAHALVTLWPTLTPRLRSEALSILLARPHRAMTLLQAMPNGLIRPADLDSNQTAFLLNHKDPKVKHLAESLLHTSTASARSNTLAEYQSALELQGNPQSGHAIFTERCASCHRLAQEGHAVGPDLVSVRNNGRPKMLMNIIDPSLELLPQYTAYEVETHNGESLLGILVDETTHSVTLRQAFGTETRLQRDDIESISSSSRSLMPDGLETGLSTQDVANLLEYIFTAN